MARGAVVGSSPRHSDRARSHPSARLACTQNAIERLGSVEWDGEFPAFFEIAAWGTSRSSVRSASTGLQPPFSSSKCDIRVHCIRFISEPKSSFSSTA